MEKSLFDTTDIMINNKHGLTTTYVGGVDGTFVVKLCGLKIENNFKIQN